MNLVDKIIAGLWTASLIWLAGTAPPANAIEFRAGKAVTIAEDELIEDDLYVSGEVITIDGVVQGDVVAVGRHVEFNGSVVGDLIGAAQGVVVNGEVGDDVRVAGIALQLATEAAIGDDVLAAGFSLEAVEESLVAGSVVFSGFQALMAGVVRERLISQSTALRVEGYVGEGGEILVEGEGATPPFIQLIPSPVAIPTIPAGLTIAEGAEIAGEFLYTSADEAKVEGERPPGLAHVAVDRDPLGKGWGERFVATARRWAAILVVGLVLLLARAPWFQGRVDELRERPLAAVGSGLVGLLGIPVLALLGTVMVILLSILFGLVGLHHLVALVLLMAALAAGFVVVALWAGLFLVAPGVAAVWLGSSLRSRFGSTSGESDRGVASLFLGCALLAAVCFVPLIGGLVAAIVGLAGFGALVLQTFRPVFRLAW